MLLVQKGQIAKIMLHRDSVGIFVFLCNGLMMVHIQNRNYSSSNNILL